MSIGEQNGTSHSLRATEDTGKVVIHPATGAAAARMVSALADEFDRWMVDEIEELAQVYENASASFASHARELSALTERLIEQANLLGHPQVAAIASRLHARIMAMPTDFAPADASLARQIGELRDAAIR
ncbi:hypothetical protein EDC22_102313 [Tepidamorphus gemmatus]|jgi:hypothetical protein|uniref:Uncharacterized protein n=1 Tax=Tepidamorphus gemmatus TaxID=747076 RepID=A0A4R3MHF8_9HYPH|nr:hypothetical protein [Tepidamorphus gemmatus]TCT12628.1 hypothetical protein EDC22_102313 [Tepidamorphus gemmatus]